MKPRHPLLLALVATLFFASAPVFVRKVSLDAVSLGFCRLGLASLGMTVFLAWRWWRGRFQLPRLDARTCRALLAVGFAFGVHWLLFFFSIKIGNAAIGAIGFSTYGIDLILLGWLLGRGHVGGIEILGLLLACAGTWLLIPEFTFQNQYTLGLAIGILSGLAAAVLPLLHQYFADIDGNLRAWGQFTFALPVFACFASWAEWDLRSEDILEILYLGLGIALVAHGLWVHSSTALSTTTTSILSYLYLPISLLLGFLLLGERLTGRALLGTLLVLIANASVIFSQYRRGTLKAHTAAEIEAEPTTTS